MILFLYIYIYLDQFPNYYIVFFIIKSTPPGTKFTYMTCIDPRMTRINAHGLRFRARAFSGKWETQWRHYEPNGVSNYQRFDGLLNRLPRRRAKRLSKLRVTGRWPVNSPHKGPVTRKMFPFDDVVMVMGEWIALINQECWYNRPEKMIIMIYRDTEQAKHYIMKVLITSQLCRSDLNLNTFKSVKAK